MTRIQKNRARHLAIIAANLILFLMYSPMLLLGLLLLVTSIMSHILYLLTFLEWADAKKVALSALPKRFVKNYYK